MDHSKYPAESAQFNFNGNHNHCGNHRDVDQQVLHHCDHGRRAQARGVGEGSEDNERNDQRQIARKSPGKAERSDQTCMPTSCNAIYGIVARMRGQPDRRRQPRIAETATREIHGSNATMAMANRPQSRQHQDENRLNDYGIRHGEEPDRAGPV